MGDLTALSIAGAKKMMQDLEISPVELVKAHCARSLEQQESINAYVLMTHEHAIESAKISEKKYLNKDYGLIEGIPIGIKDLFCTKGFATTACSNMLRNFIAPYESTVTANLYSQGGIMIGKTNMDEFAMGSDNTTSCFGPVVNPWRYKDRKHVDLVAGGSSGGSAAAVAARSCMGALGSDTGGSVRQPASFSGIVGAKPTYGRASRHGMIAFASSLDQAGVLTRSVEDAAILLESICGYDVKDATSKNLAVPNWGQLFDGDVKGLKIGIPAEYISDQIDDQVMRLWKQGISWLRDAGAEIIDITLPHTKYALPVYYVLAPSEASSNLARFDGVRYGLRVEENGDDIYNMIAKTRGVGFGAEVKRRIMIGTYILSSGQYETHCLKAQKVRSLIKQDFDQAFVEVDAILTPTSPSEAFPVDFTPHDPVTMYLNDIFTVTVNLAGLPAISVPVGLSKNGLPLGLQVISKQFDETTMFKVAHSIELAAQFKLL